jgi:hypothetical protein
VVDDSGARGQTLWRCAFKSVAIGTLSQPAPTTAHCAPVTRKISFRCRRRSPFRAFVRYLRPRHPVVRASRPGRHLQQPISGDPKGTGLFRAHPGGIRGDVHRRDPLVSIHTIRAHGVFAFTGGLILPLERNESPVPGKNASIGCATRRSRCEQKRPLTERQRLAGQHLAGSCRRFDPKRPILIDPGRHRTTMQRAWATDLHLPVDPT